MNGPDHDEQLGSAALLALGTLDASEAHRVAEHARTCEACRREYASLRATADALGLSAEHAPDEVTSARMKAAVMGAVRALPERRPIAAPSAESPARTRLRIDWIPYAALAAVIALVAGLATGSSIGRGRVAGDQQTISALERRVAAQTAQLATLEAPGSKHYAVPAGDVVASQGRIYLAVRMAPLPPGKVYQAWTLRAGAKSVAPSVTFAGDAGTTVVELPEPANDLAAVAVSVEPAGGSKAPTTKPKFVRRLS